jgi:hypothetical protein
VTKVLSIISPFATPIQKMCGNYHVVDVIICSTGDVHCNVYCSKSKVHKIRFFMRFHCNQWWTCIINHWGKMAWSNCAYDKI